MWSRKISADLREAVANDEVREKLVQLGAVPAATTPDQFARLIDNDRKRYAEIIRVRNVKID